VLQISRNTALVLLFKLGAGLVVLSSCTSMDSPDQRREGAIVESSATSERQSVVSSGSPGSDDVMQKARSRADKYVAEQMDRSARSRGIKYQPVLELAEDRGDRIVFNYKMVPDIRIIETDTDIALSYDKATGKLSGLRSIYESEGVPIDQ